MSAASSSLSELSAANEPRPKSSTLRAYLSRASVGLLSVLYVAYPPLYVLLRAGPDHVFHMVRGDALLYLSIARHSQGASFTYDGETATNGFHPLWQWILTWAVGFAGPDSSTPHHVLSLLLGTLATSLGFAITALAVYQYTRSVLLALLPLAGVYYWLYGALFDNHHIWSNIDGMEGELSILFGSLVLLLMAHHLVREDVEERALLRVGPRNLFVQVGWVLPGLILSRLDDVFVLVGLGLVILALRGSFRNKCKTIAAMSAPSVVAVTALLIYNQVQVGYAMPLSGASKSGVSLFSSVYIFATGLFPPFLDLKNALSTKQSDGWVLGLNMFRAVQLLVPALFAVAYAVIVRSTFRDRLRFVVPLGLAAYVVIKALYNLVNVNLWHQGSWYYAFPILLCSFWTAILLGPAYRQLSERTAIRGTLGVAFGLFLLLSAGRAAMLRAHGEAPTLARLCADGPMISAELRRRAGNAQLLEFDDGALNYCLEQKAIHGFGFAIDARSFEALREGKLLAHAYSRGFRLLSSFHYLPVEQPLENSDQIRDFLKHSFLEERVKRELDAFDFEEVFHYVPGKTSFFRFTPR